MLFSEMLLLIVTGILFSVVFFSVSYENQVLGIEPKSIYFGQEINLSKSNGTSELPQVTAEGNNVYVVWQDNSTGNYDINFAYSSDNGKSFEPAINLSKNGGASELPQVTAEGNNVYVVWQDNSTGNYDINFAYSSDNGKSFEPAINLSKNGGASELPQVTAEGNNVYVVWQDNTTGNYDINFARSADNGTSFEPAINLSKNGGASELPQVTAEGNNVYVVWQDNTTGNYDIYLKSSSTNGINFKSMRNLSKNNGVSEFAQIEPYKDVFYIIWKDSTGSMDRIFFKEGRKDISTNNTEFGSTKKISSNANVTKPSITSGSSHISAAWISNFVNGSIIGYYPVNFFVDSNNAIQLTKLLPRDSIGNVSILSHNTETYFVWESKDIAKSEIIFKRISTANFE